LQDEYKCTLEHLEDENKTTINDLHTDFNAKFKSALDEQHCELSKQQASEIQGYELKIHE
jgi:hypothetical protein